MSRVVTPTGILRILRRSPRVKSVVLHTETIPTLLRRGRITGQENEFGNVKHIQTTQALLGVDYEDYVNQRWIQSALKHLNLSGDIPKFEAQALWNGFGVHDGLYTVRHRKSRRRYLYFYPLRQGESKYVDERGNEINLAKLGEFLKLRGISRSGISWRTVNLENIVAVEYNNSKYELVPFSPRNSSHSPPQPSG
jgi:hypothetical protein